MNFNEINWKAAYEQLCEENKKTDEEFDQYNLTEDQKIFDAFEGSAQELISFKKGYAAAKMFYNDIVKIRTKIMRDDGFFLRKKTKELIQAEQKIKDLIAECELYSGCLKEMESQRLIQCARFLRTLKDKAKRKIRSMYWLGKSFLRCFMPDNHDDRSALYKTLQRHLGKEDSLVNKTNTNDKE